MKIFPAALSLVFQSSLLGAAEDRNIAESIE